MTTKKPQKLSARARKKEATGINVEAAKKRDRKILAQLEYLNEQRIQLELDVEQLWQFLEYSAKGLLRWMEQRKK